MKEREIGNKECGWEKRKRFIQKQQQKQIQNQRGLIMWNSLVIYELTFTIEKQHSTENSTKRKFQQQFEL